MALALLGLWLMLLPFAQGAKADTLPAPAASTELGVDQIVWMTEPFPPYNFPSPQGQPRGLSVEALSELWRLEGKTLNANHIRFIPWARAYSRLQREPQSALFSMTLTPERRRLFKFVGPVWPIRIVVMMSTARYRQLSKPLSMEKLVIGVVHQDIGEQLLLQTGVDESILVRSRDVMSLVELMRLQRVDAIAYAQEVAHWYMDEAGIDPAEYRVVQELLSGQLGFAFHSGTPQALIDRLNTGVETLRSEGRLQQIWQRYMPNTELQ